MASLGLSSFNEQSSHALLRISNESNSDRDSSRFERHGSFASGEARVWSLEPLLDLFSSVRFGIVLLVLLFIYMAIGSAGLVYPVSEHLLRGRLGAPPDQAAPAA